MSDIDLESVVLTFRIDVSELREAAEKYRTGTSERVVHASPNVFGINIENVKDILCLVGTETDDRNSEIKATENSQRFLCILTAKEGAKSTKLLNLWPNDETLESVPFVTGDLKIDRDGLAQWNPESSIKVFGYKNNFERFKGQPTRNEWLEQAWTKKNTLQVHLDFSLERSKAASVIGDFGLDTIWLDFFDLAEQIDCASIWLNSNSNKAGLLIETKKGSKPEDIIQEIHEIFQFRIQQYSEDPDEWKQEQVQILKALVKIEPSIDGRRIECTLDDEAMISLLAYAICMQAVKRESNALPFKPKIDDFP